jgi:LuxR family maltose regulon positive regulatory protein
MSNRGLLPEAEELLQNKLDIPNLTGRVLRRARLTNLFDKPVERKVIMLAAPAGYGKTTLIGEWLSVVNAPDRRTAWVALDEYDDDPVRFWRYLVSAIRKAYGGIQYDETNVLAEGLNSRNFFLLIPLINEVSAQTGYLNLVLDNYHHINHPEIHAGMAYLMEHQPKNMTVVITGRIIPALPLARLRTSGRLISLGADDLSFSFEETRKYLADTLEKDLKPEELLAVYEKTEGWISGLKMFALKQTRMNQPEVTGTLHYAECPIYPEYFWEEVLSGQPPDIQDFLIKTSILGEISAELCDELLNTNTSRQVISALAASCLFLQPADRQGIVYRYHPLFACSLTVKLEKCFPDLLPQLHDKALEWFLGKGMTEKAIHHALRAGHVHQAADLLEEIAINAIPNFDVAKIVHWIDAIPDSVMARRPKLAIYNAVADFALNRYEKTAEKLTKANAFLRDLPDADKKAVDFERLQWQIDALLAALEANCGDPDIGLSDGKRLLENKTYEKDYIFGMVSHFMGIADDRQGRLADAVADYEKARQYGVKHGHIYGFFHSTIALAHVYMQQGRLNEARQELILALEHAVRHGLENATLTLAQTGLLEIALEQNEPVRAEKLARETLADFDKTIVSESVWINHIERCIALANYFVAKKDAANARQYFERALDSHQGLTPAGNPLPANILETCRRILILESRKNGSGSWHTAAGAFLDPISRETLAGKMLQARIEMGQGNDIAARDLMETQAKKIRKSEYQDLLIHALVLYALTLFKSDEKTAAFVYIEDALQIGAACGYGRVFTEEGDAMNQLLNAYKDSPGFKIFEQKNPGFVENLVRAIAADRDDDGLKELEGLEQPVVTSLWLLREPLSSREMEVLQLLNNDKSTKEIAEALMISVNTAKTHVMRIFRKFDVHSRKMLLDRIREQNQ